jgi:hypothetical protein
LGVKSALEIEFESLVNGSGMEESREVIVIGKFYIVKEFCYRIIIIEVEN